LRPESFGLSRWVKGIRRDAWLTPRPAVHTAWMPRSCRPSALPLELIMNIGPLLGTCRTHWIRDSTASERSGFGVSWRSSRPGAPGPCCWWCQSDASSLWFTRCGPRDQPTARSVGPVRTAVPVRAVVRSGSSARSALRPFRSTVPSDRAVRLPSGRAGGPSGSSGLMPQGVPPGAGIGSIGTRGRVRR